MYGREGREHRQLSRHMLSVPLTTTKIAGVIDFNGSCFTKDGSKICVGDCALFKPAKDSPPFVGIIRCWTSEKEGTLKFRVNWLYRPSDIKLLKGAALEAAPNEVFYSFHSDEIPAAALLHPCKVAFLPKGVDLPPGISSFVCRRVYDITNKCLWWLTDQDYIDDRQEEVDQLLRKTRTEMHASVEQQDSRSPKPVNGSTASPLKHSPDSVQNSSSNLSSHRKGKKRERGDQYFDVSKRERSSKHDDVDSGQLKSESTLTSEISKLSEKGGLTDSESVARLVRLMQLEKSEKKIDLSARCMLAWVIAATDKFDCLNHFVHLRGLLVLNEWLQEVHKGKITDSGNVKNGDKSVDDFLFILLRALDKLPVNLNALQMCNIGKSVNHLRSHKNSEIQKKARSLVDTWKKRVEAEMSIGEVDRASLKGTSVKHLPGDSNSKSASLNPGGARSTMSPTSTTDNCNDKQSQLTINGGSSEPQIVAKEEKSSSSSQSHTNSQCSSEQAKHVGPGGKEDTRRSTAGSKCSSRTVGVTKHRKSTNGPSGIHRESVSTTKSLPVSKNEKLQQSGVDSSSVQESNNHKIIVKIGNRGRVPSQSSVGVGLEESSCRNSRDSSPSHSEKHDQSKQDSQQYIEVNETKSLSNVSKIASSPSSTEMKSRKVSDPSFSSMNALIESCAKISEANNVSMSVGDDLGMNLLASVAASEISSKSDHKQLLADDDDVIQHGRSSEVVDHHVDGEFYTICPTKAENSHQSVEKSASDPCSETVKLVAKEESQSELRVAGPNVGGSSLEASIKDEFETKAQRDNTTSPPNVDDEKKNVNQLRQSDVVLDQSAPVALSCDPMNRNEKSKPVMGSSGTSQPLTAEISIEVKSEKIDAKMTLEKETLVSTPEKQPESEGYNLQTLDKKDPDALREEDANSNSNLEASKFPPTEEEIKAKSGPPPENVTLESCSGGPDMESKLGFDLNEGFDVDDGKNNEPVNFPVSVTIAARAKGPFVPPDDLLWNKTELGWKGSAATSAFRPAEPRKSMEVPLGPTKPARVPLDIDLNVADESSCQEFSIRNSPISELTTTASLRNSGGLDLDLNKVDEAPEMAHMGSNILRVEISTQNSSVSGKRDFDLNDGPTMDDMPVEQTPSSLPNRTYIPFQQPLGPRLNTSELGNCFPWYPPGSSYTLGMTPSVLPDREGFSIVGIGGGPQHVMGGPTSALSFNPDPYRGSVLSSSPALPFHSPPFQYPVLPFGASFPLPSSALGGGSSGYIDPATGGRISAIPSQMIGNPGPISFQYPHAYVVSRSMPDVGNRGVVESSHKWGKQGLDLNSGPGSLEVEGRDESLPSVSRQGPTISSQSLVDEQARMYSMGGGHLKRKEPEGGWNIDKFNFKQSSWR